MWLTYKKARKEGWVDEYRRGEWLFPCGDSDVIRNNCAGRVPPGVDDADTRENTRSGGGLTTPNLPSCLLERLMGPMRWISGWSWLWKFRKNTNRKCCPIGCCCGTRGSRPCCQIGRWDFLAGDTAETGELGRTENEPRRVQVGPVRRNRYGNYRMVTGQQLYTCAVRSGPTWNPHRPLEMNGQETEETGVFRRPMPPIGRWLVSPTVGINGAEGPFLVFRIWVKTQAPHSSRAEHSVSSAPPRLWSELSCTLTSFPSQLSWYYYYYLLFPFIFLLILWEKCIGIFIIIWSYKCHSD